MQINWRSEHSLRPCDRWRFAMRWRLTLAVAAFLGSIGHSVQACDLTPLEAVELFRVATSAIRSFDVVVDVQNESLAKEEVTGYHEPTERDARRHPIIKFRPYREGESPRKSQQKFRQVFEGSGGRIETIDPDTGVVKRVLAGKGDVWKTKQFGGTTATIQQMPIQPIPDGANYLTLFRNGLGQADLLTILQQRPNLRVISESGNETRRFLFIDAPPEPEGNLGQYGFVVKLDRDHGFMPCEFEVYGFENGTRVTTRKTTIDNFLQIPGNCWVPIQATTTIFDRQAVNQPFALDKRVTTVDQSKSAWNRPIPEQLFEVEIPRGTIVRDTRNNATFVEGQPDTEKNLAGLVDDAKHIVEQMPPRTATRGNWTLYLTMLAAGVGVCCFLVWMRRGKLGSKT